MQRKQSRRRGNRHVLLIEDEKNLVDMYTVALRSYNFDLQTAQSADDALKLLEEQSFDIILLDILIPATSHDSLDVSQRKGLDVLEIIRKHPRFRTIPVLILTNLDDIPDRKRAETLHAQEYILKTNVLPKDIGRKIEVILQQR
ncbi:MAG: hypothetical protein A3B74_01510 [Candidatus Kerfeldbacteria bacterium RIFCSPHIGHO2_02_FULL_42_14]|uniref:Response regulatory domain-containing protein n=1 Tax=Candidatus Kerfeldbacteria bacterium RIFCSPHIGHO2_02_FULL_42_14 TaxID=1798540 RepID=A0A1G2ASM4_9BACT|nr:MAG: hypothetical protein A3B74_01510 [Candidatus Kerfeldbacteria bacterium RIFCSPHIGHO2_02_FULL_42_14]OGY82296.1 MAG: hypothetical protein A3E60_03710 [Candidatus Kerfeldbacteria bacterium RIFCSPHIGHO2_12_FULL_42_13]OGY84724.1 MAG: hypothetical protein A3I91_05510 [Candidatus Kerfeldbacteria bacterium RIFCSPLOWO2_02_FULL_42_19]OGY85955.1 MAG: hypothetical protein A3G01_03415 [Candidatus Kerfeldbacteria bacterium RIFCSPLOWO2_12_FULL_43_9]